MRPVAILLLVVVSVGGWVGGAALLVDGDGSALGLSRDLLPSWYGGDFRPAGLWLAVAFGLGGAAAAGGLWRRPSPRAWAAVALVGAALVAWMVVQILLIGLAMPPMQLGFLGLGAVLVALALAGPGRGARLARGGPRSTRG